MWLITKKEINDFFSSWIGYLILTVFLVIATLFIWFLDSQFNLIQAGFADLNVFFTLSPWLMIFLLPAICIKGFAIELKTGTLEILLKINWVKPSGRKNVPGKPIQYVTTEDFLSHFNLQKLTDLPNVEELTSAGLIDTGNIDTSIFGTGKFFKEQINEKKENIYSNIDDMLNQTLKDDE